MYPLLLAIVIAICISSTVQSLEAGQDCNPEDFRWHALENEHHKFLYCDTVTKTLKINTCPTINGQPLFFDAEKNRCFSPRSRTKRTPGIPKSSNVGEACSLNTDCKDNMYCPSGTCQCNPAYVGRTGSSACLPTINPGQPGCTDDIQCTGGWPGTTCVAGSCQCSGTTANADTQDGTVCVTASKCPLPSGTTFTGTTVIDNANDATCKYGATDGTADADYCADTSGAVIDIYDCIPKTFPATSGISGTGTDGLCCPSRALACIQPKMAAGTAATTTETRYWYNSITGGCEPFVFDLAGTNTANSNAFQTIEHCLSYCGSTCKHGPPRLTSAMVSSASGINRAQQCTATSDCGTDTTQTYTCTRTGQVSSCCPTAAFVCGINGGRQVSATDTPSISSNSPDPGVAPSAGTNPSPTRWAYSSTTGTCTSFQYLGTGGNFNNFFSQAECLSFCSTTVCDQGSPLKTAIGTNQACAGGRGCPTTYECKSNVCCPRKQTVCIQPRSTGTCASSIPTFWYNAATGDCEAFQYTGCGGNDNNFASYATCITYCREIRAEPRCIQGEADKDSAGKYVVCSSSGGISSCRANYECYFDGTNFGCCPVKSWTCSLQQSTGTACITPTGRWYYNTVTRTCQAFTFGGCDGNSNNFLNRDDCERYCGSGGCPYGGAAYVDPATSSRRTCSLASNACPATYDCLSVTLAGSTVNACCLSRLAVCQENPLQGSTVGATVQRYYFNPGTRTCSTFNYFGTGGNENNFATLAQCTNFCASAACALGEIVGLDANTQRAVTCSSTASTTCPTGYTCRQDTLFNRFVCCGSTDAGVCPTGEKAFMDAYTLAPRECRTGVTGDCYGTYLCRPNQARNRNYCCAPAAGSICPAGRAVIRDATTQLPQTCFISTVNTCPTGYSCQTTVAGSIQSQGFCCTINSVCPNNADFAPDANQSPRVCVISTTGTNPCPDGFTCQSTTTGTTTGYCCRTGAVVSACGTLTPVIDPATNIARVCSATNACPSGTCTLNVQTGVSYCCTSTGGTDPDGCGIGLIAYREPSTTVIRTCTVGPSANCPTGFSCQSTTAGQFRCCGVSSGCPFNSAAFINPTTGGVTTCTAGSTCQSGFSCLSTTTSGFVCCSSGTTVTPNTGICPAGVPLLSGSTSQTCSDTQPCSGNYECLPTSQGLLCCPSRVSACSQPLQAGTTCSTGTAQTRYYYDTASGICNSFNYQGCSGNDNNFATQQACDLFCARGVCTRGEPARTGSSYQLCTNGLGCTTGFQCTTPRYGPTGNQICCPTAASACPLGTDPGASCGSASSFGVTRYAYNSGSRTCSAFSYFGCGGNANNFLTSAECQTSCQTTVVTTRCPLTTQTPYIPTGGTTPQTCNPGPCPTGFQCVNSGNGFICCSTQANMCPAGTSVATNAATGAALSCMTAACPATHRCTYSASYRFYYCCSRTTGNPVTPGNGGSGGCPNNGLAYFTSGSPTPALCSAAFPCPSPYQCQTSSQYSTTICCRSAASSVVVPSPANQSNSNRCTAGSAYLYPGINKPLACDPSAGNKCPSGYSCKQAADGSGNQCCS